MVMEVVNSWYEKFGGNDIKKVQETIKKSVATFQFESVSFIVLAHEYAANPADKKFLSFMYLYFNDAGPFLLNLSYEAFTQLSKLLNDPDIKGTNLKAKELIPGTIFHAKPVPVTLNADQLKVKGGFKLDGAANYNLAIKAIDVAADSLDANVGRDLPRVLAAASPGPGVEKDMKEAYKVLLPFWGDSDLTKYGFTAR